MAEHYRPTGLAYGYYCIRCGAAGTNMYGTDHGPGKCESNPELVAELRRLNSVKEVRKREFASKLRGHYE